MTIIGYQVVTYHFGAMVQRSDRFSPADLSRAKLFLRNRREDSPNEIFELIAIFDY